MKEELLAEIVAGATRMNALSKSLEATVEYDLLADGLWWSDERPKSGDDAISATNVLRCLFHYRTGLITSAPTSQFLELWEAARGWWPNWPGFSPERCRADDVLTTLHKRMKARGHLSVDLFDIIYRLRGEVGGLVPGKLIEKHAFANNPPEISVLELFDLTNRCILLARKIPPPDLLDRVRNCVAASLGIDSAVVTSVSLLVRDLGAG